MYLWRKMDEKQREDAMNYRRSRRFPKHCPPHFDFEGERQYLITPACYEHFHIVGKSPERMTYCETEILETCEKFSSAIYAWCILPNHYHVLLKTEQIKLLRKEIGLFHGRASFKWNGEDNARGRQVWHNCFERAMKSERHFFASLNYVLHNPVHHGYCERWQDWQWSNAKEYLEQIGKEKASAIWRDYPILDYGKKWDVF
ncbi:MAG: transposase [Acidobacteriota bacterium]|nr:transposase [Acidobacteriota bacterium]